MENLLIQEGYEYGETKTIDGITFRALELQNNARVSVAEVTKVELPDGVPSTVNHIYSMQVRENIDILFVENDAYNASHTNQDAYSWLPMEYLDLNGMSLHSHEGIAINFTSDQGTVCAALEHAAVQLSAMISQLSSNSGFNARKAALLQKRFAGSSNDQLQVIQEVRMICSCCRDYLFSRQLQNGLTELRQIVTIQHLSSHIVFLLKDLIHGRDGRETVVDNRIEEGGKYIGELDTVGAKGL